MHARRVSVLAFAGFASLVGAETIRVPADAPTVQAAIDLATDGDEIVLAQGVYRESLVVPGSIGALTIRSETPGDEGVVEATVLSGDADGDGAGDHRILLVDAADAQTLITLAGLTFADGSETGDDPVGGAVLMEGGTLDVDSCVFLRNRVDGLETSRGGAIAFANGTLTVSGSRFEGNERNPEDTDFSGYPFDGGGAIHGAEAVLTIHDSVFVGNRANHAAAVHGGENTDLTMIRCEVRGNRVISDAIVLLQSGTLALVDSDIVDNEANDFCAGVKSRFASDVLIDSCRFEGNLNILGRQGVLAVLDGEVLITGSIFEGNRTLSLGAVPLNEIASLGGDRVRISGSRFLANRGFGSVEITFPPSESITSNSVFIGHLIDSPPWDGVSPTVVNCVFIDEPQGIWSAPSTSYASCVGTFDLVATNRGGFAIGQSAYSIYPDTDSNPGPDAGPGNVDAMPAFLRDPDDGGDGWGDDPMTPDIDESANDDYGDLRLVPGSPAIDSADNTAVAPDFADLDNDGDTDEPTPFDFAGNPRFLDDPGTPDTGVGPAPVVDMGAYEFDGTCSIADLATPWGLLDLADVTAFVSDFDAADPGADLAIPFGTLDLADVVAFVTAFADGCG